MSQSKLKVVLKLVIVRYPAGSSYPFWKLPSYSGYSSPFMVGFQNTCGNEIEIILGQNDNHLRVSLYVMY